MIENERLYINYLMIYIIRDTIKILSKLQRTFSFSQKISQGQTYKFYQKKQSITNLLVILKKKYKYHYDSSVDKFRPLLLTFQFPEISHENNSLVSSGMARNDLGLTESVLF